MFEWSFEDLIRQFVGRTSPPVRYVAHVLETGLERKNGFVTQFLFGCQLLEQRQFEWVARVAP